MNNKPRILIVEDDETNRFIMFKNLGEYDCDFAIDGAEVLKKMHSNRYDIILMDINLGNDKLNGEILMRIIKLDNQQLHTKIIAVTSYAMDGDREHFLQAGFDMYLSKPILKNELQAAIRQVLKQRVPDVKLTEKGS